jgi:ATP-dependent Clp protease ATP-binding subunit ClpA
MGRVIQEHLKPLPMRSCSDPWSMGVVKVELINDSLSFDYQVNVEAVSH